MRIELPYPPPVLSPNARKHFMVKARAAKKYKNDCLWTIGFYVDLDNNLLGKQAYKVTFCPPDKHRRDLDNAIAAFKYGIDALSHVSGVDDSKFQLTFAWGEPVKGGAVIIEAA